jgi:hypothetical protein
MLKELFEASFYVTFPKVQNKVLNLTEIRYPDALVI